MGQQGQEGKAGVEKKTFPFRSSECPLPRAWIARHLTVRVCRAEFQPNRVRHFEDEELLLRVNRVRSARNFVRIFEEMAESSAALHGPNSSQVRVLRGAAQVAALMARYRLRELLEMLLEFNARRKS